MGLGGKLTDGFGGAHRPPDYLYDRTLTRQGLAGYRLLLMPMSLALSEAQARTVIAFVQGGGTLLLGIGVGHCDEWGEPRPTNPLGEAFGFAWERIPSPEADEIEAVTLVPAEGGEALNVLGLHAPFRLRGDEWQVLYRHGTTPDAAPAIATRPWQGAGSPHRHRPGAPAGWQAVYGGDTRIAVTDERAPGPAGTEAGGRPSGGALLLPGRGDELLPRCPAPLPACASPATCGWSRGPR